MGRYAAGGARRSSVCLGALCGWAEGLLTLSTAHSESYDSCLEVLWALVKRTLQTPITITTDGALGLIKAVEAMNLLLSVWGHEVADAVSSKDSLHGLYSDASAGWF